MISGIPRLAGSGGKRRRQWLGNGGEAASWELPSSPSFGLWRSTVKAGAAGARPWKAEDEVASDFAGPRLAFSGHV
jgi:hypothetical protein